MRCCYFSGHCRSFQWTSWTSILDHCSEEKMSQDKGRALVNAIRGEGGSSLFENDDEQTCSMRE